MFTELSLGCWSSGQVSSSTVTCTYMSPVLLKVVCQEIKHDIVRWVTELHLSTKFVFVSSEICGLNQNKKEYFQFMTFPGHIIF